MQYWLEKKVKRRLSGLLVLMLGLSASSGATSIETYRKLHEMEILSDFRQFLSLPNVAVNKSDMLANAEWIEDYIGRRGFSSETVTASGAPYVIAERNQPGATKTILIYAHFDGQPVEPANWGSPPFEPTLRDDMVENSGKIIPWSGLSTIDPEWRIFARSAGDDKAPIIALMAALDALEADDKSPSVNIKLILDGEEEIGSPTLDRILDAHGDRLNADLMLFCDGPMHQSRQRQLMFGVRGSMTLDLTAYGPSRPLHSGHYGGWAPNPTEILIKLLADMKDDQGRIVIPGYLDDVTPTSEAEKAAISALPAVDEALRQDLAISTSDGGGKRIDELLMGPAIIVKGFNAGGVGTQSRNIILPSATVSLNLRLAPGQTPASVRAAMTHFFEDEGLTVYEREPTKEERANGTAVLADWRPGGYRAFRSKLDSPEAQRLTTILNAIDGKDTLLTPTMGGSLPIYLFEDTFPEMPIILMPIANHDNNQHGRNENLRIQNLWDAIEIYASIIKHFGDTD